MIIIVYSKYGSFIFARPMAHISIDLTQSQPFNRSSHLILWVTISELAVARSTALRPSYDILDPRSVSVRRRSILDSNIYSFYPSIKVATPLYWNTEDILRNPDSNGRRPGEEDNNSNNLEGNFISSTVRSRSTAMVILERGIDKVFEKLTHDNRHGGESNAFFEGSREVVSLSLCSDNQFGRVRMGNLV
ncbi:hypothetical protein K435DRAFT_857256 [Dendrothele bispora CBS 962.96]|uniref:Uncharacterized protein n=1 Tax=Dendrothele bispora (strain CBS 962.96) TaxID=1314807 RepID=A0A4S8M6A8_DENBC|nr:hypothetical protein K435DRAFT_857256 [Dendrothele bispora CBS 962.96]